MRIAYLGSKGLPSKSGTERVVEAIVTRLSGKHEITVYCDSRYTPAETKVAGVHLIRIATIKGKHIQAPYLFFISVLHALFCRYDLIHLHGTDACFMLPILRIKYKVVIHGTWCARTSETAEMGKDCPIFYPPDGVSLYLSIQFCNECFQTGY